MFNVEKVAIGFVMLLLMLVCSILWDIYRNVRRFVTIVERVADEHGSSENDSTGISDGSGVVLTGPRAGERVPKEDRYTGAAF